MNRIKKAFENKKAFIAFVTGGDPNIETTEALIPQMAEAGADLIEIGIPFSDPIAEGVVVQQADERALKAQTTIDKLFDMVKRVRKKVDVPLVFMTYMNPVYAYGTKRFTENCAECGIDGVIIPDVPFEERDEVQDACEEQGIVLISMIAPASKKRIGMIAKEAKGFLYCVSSHGIAHVRNDITANMKEIVAQVKEVSDIPCAIGSDISTPEQAKEIAAVADGAIVGTAIVELIAQYGKNCIRPVCAYIKEMKAAVLAA